MASAVPPISVAAPAPPATSPTARASEALMSPTVSVFEPGLAIFISTGPPVAVVVITPLITMVRFSVIYMWSNLACSDIVDFLVTVLLLAFDYEVVAFPFEGGVQGEEGLLSRFGVKFDEHASFEDLVVCTT